MTVLLIADVNEGALAVDAVAKTLAAVAGLGDVHVLVAGTGGDAAAAEAAKLSGVSKVLFAEDHAYCHGMAESTAALVVGLAGGYSHICGAATAFNKNVLPRVAALLDVMVISDATNVVDADTFERPIYAGNAVQTVKSSDGKKVMTVRTAGFTAVPVVKNCRGVVLPVCHGNCAATNHHNYYRQTAGFEFFNELDLFRS